MEKIACDISLDGSTFQWLTYNLRTVKNTVQLTTIFKRALQYRAKTKPARVARRVVCLTGLIYEKVDKKDREIALDCLIAAIKQL